MPRRHLTRPRAGAPMTDAEWDAVVPCLWVLGCGMATPGERRPGRLDAIFRAVTLKSPGGGRARWSDLPEGFGKPDNVHRSVRRRAAAGLWSSLTLV